MERAQRLDDISRALSMIINTKIQSAHQKIDLIARFPNILENKFNSLNQSILHIGQMLTSLSYKNVLQRGYAIVRDKDNNIISTQTAVPASIEFIDGVLKL